MNNSLLSQVYFIDTKKFYDNIKNVKITLLSDVKNVLFGKNRYVYIYAKQKGAKDYDLPILENNLRYFYDVEKSIKNISNIQGSGSAGGIGASILSFFDYEIKSGIDHYTSIN